MNQQESSWETIAKKIVTRAQLPNTRMLVVLGDHAACVLFGCEVVRAASREATPKFERAKMILRWQNGAELRLVHLGNMGVMLGLSIDWMVNMSGEPIMVNGTDMTRPDA